MGSGFHGGTAVKFAKHARPGCSIHRSALKANEIIRFIWWVLFPTRCWQCLQVLLHVLTPSSQINTWEKVIQPLFWDGCPNPTLHISMCSLHKGGFGRGHCGIASWSGCGRCPQWDFLCHFHGRCLCLDEMYPISEINHCSTVPCNFPHWSRGFHHFSVFLESEEQGG